MMLNSSEAMAGGIGDGAARLVLFDQAVAALLRLPRRHRLEVLRQLTERNNMPKTHCHAMHRSALRLRDLKQPTRWPTRLMNVKVPVKIADAISALAEQLGASKTEVVLALLNEGLAVNERRNQKAA